MRLLLLLVGLSTLLNHSYTQNCKTPCLPNAKCEVLDEVAACFCSTGYTGNGITICEDVDECNETSVCGDHAVCENTNGGFSCFCVEGYQTSTGKTQFTPNDGSYCQDVDECNETSVCGDHAVCENTNGGFSCFCVEGYQTSTGKTQFTPNDGSYCQEIVNSNCHLEHDCIAANINKTLKRIGPITEQLTLLHEIYKNSEAELSLVDIVTYIEILTESSSLQGYIKNTTSPKDAYFGSALTEFGKTVNNFVEKNTHEMWDQLPTNRRRLHLTKLMHAAEHVTLQISQNIQKNTQFDMNSTDLALKVFVFDSVHMKHTHPHMNVDGGYVKISPRRKSAYDPNGNVIVAFLCYRSIGPLLSSSDDFLLGAQSDNSKGKEKVISSVISASISSNPPTLYELEKITFTLSHVKLSDKHQTQCAFWNYSVDDMNNGSWSSEGCELTYSNDTHTSCRCSHLTHFAILMSPSTSIEVKDYNILTRITQLGIIISLICLAICIFTFWFFSEIQSTRTTIHKNLCCSLFLAQLVFLVGININTNKLVCSIIAGLLHYFFLAAFAWMCIEGIYLYLIVVGLIYNKGFLHKNFYIFGYLSPAVVVGFSASLGYRYYGTTKVCWLSTENNFIWSFIGPACLIILVNLLAFGVIIYKVFRHTAGLKPEVSCYENIRSCARGALALLFLLGTTWTFGVLHVVHASVVTAYLFTVSNAFQGMFIFLFLCVLSRKIQEEYYRLFKNVPCCFECLR
ncbi:EGF, latrophilin and seven transmembrane domain containing 1, isoform CRA_c [Rattus norvegicus]|uniref:Adhesion G protein-coupled receptor L4 n=2 Tax=Rattus norvegicus TaxID=10116 RepID=AGRL4_RAT|nr:adhesion G protein-coupled receptor L4 precursor [Rattus norvegicus]Q9ESC1.1 RecName: Full=Adhesion G protein-coupled receptor L4; AltName: Full=EGF,latrophilin and seven transmembrane domain-containing protein 1; AltName: Full=EGF-TM7-latrophilin-related protein; Short=ETL protein; Flags: Precursor [Rattus norvegicus]AAG33019.1 ETL protein [Rattus norvegicus]EDL82474.1 EGF, latrophilin and seven transmembrane domain containing 1, isoform CRA_c [Rattus norvegicus]|eukprot:NP_071630.1 adhesion G protein-coupled receptor L4 precursor [Rattus norvegicus]